MDDEKAGFTKGFLVFHIFRLPRSWFLLGVKPTSDGDQRGFHLPPARFRVNYAFSKKRVFTKEF